MASAQKQRIAALLQKYNIDPQKVVVGEGICPTNNKSGRRFVFHAGNREEIQNETAIIAIKYFGEAGLYLIWSVKGVSRGRELRRSKFSAGYDAVMDAISQNTDATKAVEFVDSEKEKVIILTDDTLEGYFASLNI